MSDVKDKEKKALTRETLQKQVEETKRGIQYTQNNITILTEQLHQQKGILNFTEHLLNQFDLPSDPKEESKKPDLEVK